MKYLFLMFRLASALGPLVANLGGVDAHASATTPEAYRMAANSIIADPGSIAFMAKLTPAQQASFAADLPLFLEFLDYKIESV